MGYWNKFFFYSLLLTTQLIELLFQVQHFSDFPESLGFRSWSSAVCINLCFFFSPSGDRCEFDRRQGKCAPGVCLNGGTCRELSGGGFRCECPAGGYERPYCTITARSFPPKSFAMFRGLRQRFHLSISLTWVHLKFNLPPCLVLFYLHHFLYLTT